VDPRQLDAKFVGRRFDRSLLRELQAVRHSSGAAVDSCGENGEFHSCVTAGPMFASPLRVTTGEVLTRDGFVFCDVLIDRTDQAPTNSIGTRFGMSFFS